MATGIQWVIERLVERFIPIIGGMFSSTLETVHALGQAEQHSQLEDAARRYEAEGKPDIAAALRARAVQLMADDSAAQGLRIADSLSARPLSASSNGAPAAPTPPCLPTPSAAPKPRRKKPGALQDTQLRPTLPPIDPSAS